MTVGEVDEQLLKLEDLIFRAETGQLEISWNEYRALQNQVDEMTDTLAHALAQYNDKPYEEMSSFLKSRSGINKLHAMEELHKILRPNYIITSEEHSLLKKFYDEGISQEEGQQAHAQYITSVYGYLFVKAPRPPEAATDPKSRLFSKIFRR